MASISNKLRQDRKGNVAMIVALAVTPLIGVVGLAVDAGAALRRQERLQAAVDSGVLAGLKAMPYLNDAGVTAASKRYIDTNFNGLPYTFENVVIDRRAARVEITASSPSPTIFGGVFGIGEMKVNATSVAAGGGTIELVMALDNSGSMRDAGRMPALKEAATKLVDTLMSDSMISGRIKIGVVPFSTAVNVGPSHRGESWMDNAGDAPMHGENFSPYAKGSENRFAMFDRLRVSWAGCVEARSTVGDLDVNDAAPTSGSTRFVPMFAPDEPDTKIGSRHKYFNQYLNDETGTCKIPGKDKDDERIRQERVCKYADQTPFERHPDPAYNWVVGPNFKCESIPLLPLTANKSLVVGKLAAMEPRGNTNIVEGAAWGWRVLTNSAPFSEGAPNGQTGNRKVMIVMTDGENTMSGQSLWTGLSAYSAYGYASKGRVRSPATSEETTLRNAMNDRLRLACRNAKSAGVEIYSIIVSAPNDTARAVMEDCASPNGETQHSFAISSASELGDVFEQIARSVKEVRLAR
jgi:Flp pilus assembly protein TadG